MRQSTCSLLLFGLLWPLALPPSALAHTQQGPPYLRVNGDYVETNPLADLAPGQIPHGRAPGRYLAGEPIEFSIDLNVIRNQSEFRWRWQEGGTEYQTGTKVTHTYAQAGSYTVILQAQNESISDRFVDYDTVQVDVVPKTGYVTPSARVVVEAAKKGSGYEVSFKASPAHDPATSITEYRWLFGDGFDATGQTVSHTYQEGSVQVFPVLSVKDGHGLSAHTGFELSFTDDKVVARELPFSPGTVEQVGSGSGGSAFWRLLWPALGVAALLTLAVLLRRRRR
ncbi:PKD domain-containing protein [Candidatus Parcubacteria bacterium]|nr:PKD domain-containing protein [Candidatus Parcubacteria bacterium]